MNAQTPHHASDPHAPREVSPESAPESEPPGPDPDRESEKWRLPAIVSLGRQIRELDQHDAPTTGTDPRSTG
jgi:hypothetical protein